MARPRKPLHLKLISGTVRPDRENPDAPTPAVGKPVMPPHLTGDARDAWTRFAALLDRMGVLSVADGMALERLCQCYAEIRAFERIIAAAGGPSYQPPATDKHAHALVGPDGAAIMGLVRMRPEVSALADADRRFKSWLSEFGLTPAARGKVKTVEAVASDPADEYF